MELILFADDTNIFMMGSDLHKLVECINSELEKSLAGLELALWTWN